MIDSARPRHTGKPLEQPFVRSCHTALAMGKDAEFDHFCQMAGS